METGDGFAHLTVQGVVKYDDSRRLEIHEFQPGSGEVIVWVAPLEDPDRDSIGDCDRLQSELETEITIDDDYEVVRVIYDGNLVARYSEGGNVTRESPASVHTRSDR